MSVELVLANTAEPFAQVLATISSVAKRRSLVQCEHDLAFRALLWGDDDKVVVLPQAPSAALQSHIKRISNWKNLRVYAPTNCTASLCESIIEEETLFQTLLDIVRKEPPAKVSAYAVTDQYIRLLELFKRSGAALETADWKGSQNCWLTRYLDSKVGFRLEVGRICDNVSHVSIPSGFVCVDGSEVAGAASWFQQRGLNCVIKANYGQSGWGLHFLRSNGLGAGNDTLAVEEVLKADEIWTTSSLVVEQLIATSSDARFSSPCIELHIGDAGPRVTCVCVQVISPEGEFLGIMIGPGYPPSGHVEKIEAFGLAVGRRFHELGIRGHFDVDFVVGDDGVIYAVETNVRRSAVTHVAGLRQSLGPGFASHYFLSEDWYPYSDLRLPVSEVFERLEGLLLDSSRGEGVVVTVLSETSPIIGYVVIAPRYERLLTMQDAIKTALSR